MVLLSSRSTDPAPPLPHWHSHFRHQQAPESGRLSQSRMFASFASPVCSAKLVFFCLCPAGYWLRAVHVCGLRDRLPSAFRLFAAPHCLDFVVSLLRIAVSAKDWGLQCAWRVLWFKADMYLNGLFT